MATVTKIIDSLGTPGVNCDFDLIDDWLAYLANESNPDQTGILRGDHGWVGIGLDLLSGFAIPTTPEACPRLIGDPGWQAGHAVYESSDPANAPRLYTLSISGLLGPGNSRHFKIQGIQTDSLDLQVNFSGETNAGIWFDSVSVGIAVWVSLPSSALEIALSSFGLLFTNCLFVGDGSSDCFYFNETQAAGSYSVALVNTVIAKGAYVTGSGWSDLSIRVLNCAEMAKEGYGFQHNAGSLLVAGNASYPPTEHTGELNPVYTFASGEGNPGVFVNSDYSYSDYRLPAGSPLIDLGVTPTFPGWDLTGLKDVAGTARPRGSGFDIGLFEYPLVPDSSSLLLCF